MALSIKDAETDRLVRRYASLRGTSFTSAIRHAVGEALAREAVPAPVAPATRGAEWLQAVREAQGMIRSAPRLDDRDHADILYDEDGLPK